MALNNDDTDHFLKNGTWDEIYILAIHWKSDLEFYKDDLRFLHHLIEKYIIWITKKENLELVKEIQHGLFEIKTSCDHLLQKLDGHTAQLGRLVENPKESEAAVVKVQHEQLETEMAQFVQHFRSSRQKVFKITEYVIDSEQLTNIVHS